MRVGRFQITWLCPDCGLFSKQPDAAAAHRDETGHYFAVVLTQERTVANRNQRHNRARRRAEEVRKQHDDWRAAALDERLAAIFGGPR